MRRIAVFVVFCFLWTTALCFGTASQAEELKLTIMIYMCGSNLESGGGSATEDFLEIVAAVPDRKDLTILVMTGGSDVQAGGSYFHADNAGVYEIISGGRIRKLPGSPAGANMGDSGTLASFLRFCQENRPADRYALILWDHGGGPLEGVCWDENSDMDHLTMKELTDALQSTLSGKLEWIGFDACLMSSLEVAGAVAPYANYMIASQEMEPSFGWNYSFLAEIDPEADGEETGRQIVDAFFTGQDHSGDILTLACIDLSAAEEAIEALDSVFSPLSETLNEEQYRAVSARRMKTTGFGKSLPGYAIAGYDLVDVRDMVEKMEQTEGTAVLLKKLEKAVVYSRANEDGANGLTIYFPYENKARFTAEWRDGYAALPFSTGYQAYVEKFGWILTSSELMDWKNLVPMSGMPDANGYYPFELQLSAEQAENVVSAQIMILGDSFARKLENNCVLLATCQAELGEDNVLRGKWDGRCLYIETENQTVGPIGFRQSNNGIKNIITSIYIPKDYSAVNGDTVLFELDADNLPEYPKINRVFVWDEMTHSYSSRSKFSEDNYERVFFFNLHQNLPNIGEELVLPPIEEWQERDDFTRGMYQSIYLPQNWRLHMLCRSTEERDYKQLYAVFRLVDSQQRVICSVPVSVSNPYRTTFTPLSEAVETTDLRVELICTRDASPDQMGLILGWTFKNTGDQDVDVQVRSLMINENRIVDQSDFLKVYAGKTARPDMYLDIYDIAELDRLDSVSGTLIISTDKEEKQEIPFKFDFQNVDLTVLEAIKPISGIEQNGISMKLLSIEPDSETGLIAYLLVENQSGEDLTVKSVSMNRLLFPIYRTPISSGMTQVLAINVDNECFTISLNIRKDEDYLQTTSLEYYLLQATGSREITEMGIEVENGQKCQLLHLQLDTPLHLADPVPIAYDGEGGLFSVWNPPYDLPLPQQDRLPMLAENKCVCIRLRRVVAGTDGIAMSIEIENKSDFWANIGLDSCTVNDQPASQDMFGVNVPPHMIRIKEVTIDGFVFSEEENAIREITLGFRDYYHYFSDAVFATIIPETPVPLEKAGGFWINGESFTTIPAILPDMPEELAEVDPAFLIARDVVTPENIASCRVTLDSGLTSEDTAGVTGCWAAVVKKTAEGYLQVFTLQKLITDAEGKLILRHPGLIMTPEKDPTIGVMIYLFPEEDGKLDGKVMTTAVLTTDLCAITSYSRGMITLSNIWWSMNRDTNTTEIVSVEQDEIPDKPVKLYSVSFSTWELIAEPNSDGVLPNILDMPMHNDFEWFLNLPEIPVDNNTVRLMLRPVTAEDELYVLFSIEREDGSRYSLPLVPYPVH